MLYPLAIISQVLMIMGARSGRVEAWVPGLVLNLGVPLYLFGSPNWVFDRLAQLFVLLLCVLFACLLVKARRAAQVLAWLVTLGELIVLITLTLGSWHRMPRL